MHKIAGNAITHVAHVRAKNCGGIIPLIRHSLDGCATFPPDMGGRLQYGRSVRMVCYAKDVSPVCVAAARSTSLNMTVNEPTLIEPALLKPKRKLRSKASPSFGTSRHLPPRRGEGTAEPCGCLPPSTAMACNTWRREVSLIIIAIFQLSTFHFQLYPKGKAGN
jgi:hypothetical protein